MADTKGAPLRRYGNHDASVTRVPAVMVTQDDLEIKVPGNNTVVAGL
jgi:hypothetical protein